MSETHPTLNVYLETGKKRTFAGAVDWPGWARGGRDAASALEALAAYRDRYAAVAERAQLTVPCAAGPSAFHVVERLEGSSTTDFGAPAAVPSADMQPLDEAALQQAQDLLQSCWQAFDAAAAAAAGKELRKGPRGGGRDLDKIVGHVLEADGAYLSRLGRKFELDETQDPAGRLQAVREAVLEGLAASARGEIPAHGPRGGARWTARYFVRRVAWHVLDHAWEIEDRLA